jgi:hypothetical protein
MLRLGSQAYRTCGDAPERWLASTHYQKGGTTRRDAEMQRGLGRAIRRKLKLLLRQYQNMQLSIPMPKSLIDLIDRIKHG